MDWAAKLFGLSEEFYNTTQVGGGVIQVSRTPRLSHLLRVLIGQPYAVDGIRLWSRGNCRRKVKVPAASSGRPCRQASCIYHHSNTLPWVEGWSHTWVACACHSGTL